MSLLEAFLGNFPILAIRNPAESIGIAAPVVAVRCPVHFRSLASCENRNSKEETLLENLLSDWLKEIFPPMRELLSYGSKW